MVANADNADNAVQLLEYLASAEAQQIYANVVYEYPVRRGVEIADTLAGFGAFKADTIDLDAFAANQGEAVRIFDRVGWR